MSALAHRRSLQFSMRTMFVAVTLFAVVLAWLAWDLHQFRTREAAADWLSEQTAIFAFDDDNGRRDPQSFILLREGAPAYTAGPLRKWLGDQEVRSIYFMVRRPTAEELGVLKAFPEASVYVPHWTHPTDRTVD